MFYTVTRIICTSCVQAEYLYIKFWCMNQRNPWVFALIMTLGFFCMIWLYVQEFPVLSNTIGGKWLVIGSMTVGLMVAAAIVWRFRDRFTPWDRHRPDVTFIIICSMFFAPLLGSWINRGLGTTEFQSFQFVSEAPFVSTGYGVIPGDKIKVSGYHLNVVEGNTPHRFKYSSQSYYPLTKPGETIMLPICKGILGARVMLLH